jgi:hypothetical protein
MHGDSNAVTGGNMKTWLMSAVALAALTQSSFASAPCAEHPKAEWMSEDAMKAKVASLGYKTKTFKVSGDCYEIYGWTKDGKKAEVYFDTKTGAVVKANID